jgi:cytochrome b6
MGTYKRQSHAWISGAFLLILAILFVFSGYLLRWDEIGYWSIKITSSIVGYTPFIGDYLEEIILGGSTISSRTLARFYAVHVSFLPMLSLALLIGMHYSIIRKLRIYWMEIGIAMVALGFLMLYSVLEPFNLAPKPSAELKTPLKPPWFFLWLYVIERGAGMISPTLNSLNILILIAIALLIILLPYIDKSEETALAKKRRKIVGMLVIVLFLVLTVIGYLWG